MADFKNGQAEEERERVSLNILHIAPRNTAGVPLEMVRAERRLGYDSRLITMMSGPQDRESGICLDLPWASFPGFSLFRKLILPRTMTRSVNQRVYPETCPPVWRVPDRIRFLFDLRERIWTPLIEHACREQDWLSADVLQLDGGLGFYRDGRWVRRFKTKGKKVIACYLGSDLRIRGVIPAIDALSDLNVTVEFDHLEHHSDIHHVPFPFDVDSIPKSVHGVYEKIRVGHAPTSRAAKGTEHILKVLRLLEKSRPIETVLIEKKPYREALRMKSTCQIFIDQLGELGYGMNAVEALAMGIPTCTSLAAGFEKAYPDHPFVRVDHRNLEAVLIRLIHNERERIERGKRSREWVRRTHDSVNVVGRIHKLAGLKNSGPLLSNGKNKSMA
ncbi:MAG TPA: glycosyltransferase family 1 protein [bacterium]|nr:glycosyltransferase family 1 protein [bacterium]